MCVGNVDHQYKRQNSAIANSVRLELLAMTHLVYAKKTHNICFPILMSTSVPFEDGSEIFGIRSEPPELRMFAVSLPITSM